MKESLNEKTVLITGASRGIGRSIAAKCDANGANVVILDKDNSDIACHKVNIDLGDANAILQAVDNIIRRFNRIDVVINNVATFCFSNTMQISPDEFDTLFSINVRAAYVLSKTCMPHLMRSTNPHIVNISPPLHMNAKWFQHHMGFTLSKYALSMCTLGMSEEFKHSGVAINSLWPLTTIATNTIENHFSDAVYKGSRFPSIMADAAYELIQRNSINCTGNFYTDEAILREAGVSDFSIYAVDPSSPLIADLFVSDDPIKINNDMQPLDLSMYKENT